MFDISKDKWFIAVANAEEAVAVQEWLVTLGCTWDGYLKDTIRRDFHVWDGPAYAIGMGHQGGGSLGQANVDFWTSRGHKEIKVKLKLVVDDYEFPVLQAEQEKQIKALEETINMAQQQIQKLKQAR